MTRLRTLLTLAALALLATPAADAQQNAFLVLRAEPLSHALSAGDNANITGSATYTADLTVLANLDGVPIRYTVTKQPTWLAVVMSPANDVFPIYPTISYQATRTWRADLFVADNATGDALDVVEITALVMPAAPLGHWSTAKVSVPVRLHAAAPEPCPDAGAAGTVAPATDSSTTTSADAPVSTGESAPAPVHVQSSAATISPLSGAAIAGFAAVGAAVGFAIWRRK